MGCIKGGGSKQSSSSTSKTETQKKWIDKALEMYGPKLGQGMNVFPGTRIAPFTSTMTDIMGQIPNFAQAFGDVLLPKKLLGEMESTASKLLKGEMGAQPITPEQETVFFERAIKKPYMKTFHEDVLPGVKEQFSGPGYWSGPRAKEGAEAYQDVGDWLGKKRAGLGWDTLLRNQQIKDAIAGRVMGTLAPAMGVASMPLGLATGALSGLGKTFGLAGEEQRHEQAQIGAAMQKFFEENQITDPQVMEVFSMLVGIPVNISSSTGSAWGPGLGYSMGTAFAGGYGSSLGGAR